MLLNITSPYRPGWRGRWLSCSRRWVRGCHRGHPSANRGSAAVNGSVAVGRSRQAGYGPTYFFRGVGSQCPSDMPELDRGVTPNLTMPFWRASAQQRGHAKPGDALLASARQGVCPKLGDEPWRASAPHGSRAKPSDALWRPTLNRGLHQARQCPSNRPVLNRGVALSPVMPLWRASAGHRGHAKPGNAPLAYQRLTGGSSQAWRCPSCVPAILRGVTPSPAMPQWRASD